MMTAAELCHELMATDDDVPMVEARDREIRAAALREVKQHLLGYSKFLNKMGFAEAADGVWSITDAIEKAAATGLALERCE